MSFMAQHPKAMRQPREAIDLSLALTTPSHIFGTPKSIIERSDLARFRKTQILKRWEYDARELSTAADESIAADGMDLLTDIHAALRELETSIDGK